MKLETVNICRKFIGIFDIFLSLFFLTNVYVSMDLLLAFRAMQAHKSQFVWYRLLFICFSRYSYVNTFKLLR